VLVRIRICSAAPLLASRALPIYLGVVRGRGMVPRAPLFFRAHQFRGDIQIHITPASITNTSCTPVSTAHSLLHHFSNHRDAPPIQTQCQSAEWISRAVGNGFR